MFIQSTMQTVSVSRIIQHRCDPNRNINLCKYSFAKGQYDLLNKNLVFYPTHGHFNRSILKKIQQVSTGFFRNKNEHKQKTELANKEPSIKSKTNQEPKKNHHTKDAVKFPDKNNLPKNNLMDTNKSAIEHFSKCMEVDKGGATVILNLKNYIAKTNAISRQQLQDNFFIKNKCRSYCQTF